MKIRTKKPEDALHYPLPINPYAPYDKLVNIINSCTTEQHFDAAIVDNNRVPYKTIKSRKYTYTTKEEAEDQFNRLSFLLLPELR